MNRKQRTILFFGVFWSLLLGVSGAWLWWADRQKQLNRDVIASLKKRDVSTELRLLNERADSNPRDIGYEPRPFFDPRSDTDFMSALQTVFYGETDEDTRIAQLGCEYCEASGLGIRSSKLERFSRFPTC